MENEEVSFGDTIFGFWDEFHQPPSGNSSNSSNDDEDYDDEDESFSTKEKNKAFWEEQDQLLQATLYRTSSIETKVRHATKDSLRELSVSETLCICRRPVEAKSSSCRVCLQREIRDRLLSLGYNCSICKSKWISSPGVPSGEHTYLEVIDKSSNSKRGEVKVVIELNLRAEFEMARANEEYNQLTAKLPEVYVGKTERLRMLVKIMCSAAKKCMKEKKMHLAPWRKQKYMQAKWLGTYDRSSIIEPLPRVYTTRPQKPMASMLTCDLLEKIPGLHCTTAVKVV